MYLWELSLENIPLGWEELYKSSVGKSANSEIVELPDCEYYYNMEDCKKLLETNFISLKNEAAALYNDLQSNLHRLNRLIEIDISLYAIINFWTCTENDYSCFNPNSLQTQLCDTSSYFAPCSIEMEKYEKMKFIHLSKNYQLD